MAVIVLNNNFIRQITQKTTGRENSFTQVFYTNNFCDSMSYKNNFFSFNLPIYYTIGGTYNYYGQDPNSIYTDVLKPTILFNFTANTSSFGSGTTLIHDFYKIPYNSTGTTPYSSMTSYVANSIYALTTQTTNILNNKFNLSLPDFVQGKNGYNFKMYEDRCQYFIDTNIYFKGTNGNDYDQFYTISKSGKTITSLDYNPSINGNTNNKRQNIQGGIYSGISFVGLFFSYFVLPNRPNNESTFVNGQLNTFSPTFFYSNVEDGDSEVLQINYAVSDTGFTGTLYNYPIEKNDVNKNILTITVSGISTTKIVRNFSTVLTPGKEFLYRIGNKKELTNIFGIKQSVTMYSSYLSARTSDDSISGSTGTGTETPYSGNTGTTKFTLNGIVYGGNLASGATIQLTYPNSSYVTTSTNNFGNFNFIDLDSGIYTLTTSYRGFKTKTQNINISGNTNININMELIWGNSIDTWGDFGGLIPYFE